RIFAAADVMALPSASEGLANAWVESLACGTPIVISDVGGARELLDRPEAGQIVERDPQAIAAAIRTILDDPPPPEKVREAALRFTWAANGDALLAHLQGIAASA
ncbi:MAG: glycosyltransferase, partial [Alphaproteobacteria bacterium]